MSAPRNARDFPLLGATWFSIRYKAIGNQDFVVPKEIRSSQGGSPYPTPLSYPEFCLSRMVMCWDFQIHWGHGISQFGGYSVPMKVLSASEMGGK